MLQVRKEWLLLLGGVAAEWVGKATREELIELSEAYWPNGLKSQDLLQCITSYN